jgi:Na+-translocating ferredoxin:NAD+ oxidoreductase subunit G
MAEAKKANYLVQAWLVLTLAAGFGAALAGVHIALKDGIEANKRNKTYDQIPNLVPGADKKFVKEGEFIVDIDGAELTRKYYTATTPDGKNVVGYMLRAEGMGYVDKIEVLVGVDAKVKIITGVYILAQVETPGLGSKIRDDDFVTKFINKSCTTSMFALKTEQLPESNDIQAITSATISSQSVCSIVNGAVREFGEFLDASIQREQAMENIPKMFPDFNGGQLKQIAVGDGFVYKVTSGSGDVLAWVAGGKRMGRWDRIDLLVALDAEAQTISKVLVVDQRERWWKKVVKAGYVESFVGKKAQPVVMVKPKATPGDQQVQAVTKATTTSTAICRIVNKAVQRAKTAAAADKQDGAVVEDPQ